MVMHMCTDSAGTRICLKRDFLSQKQAVLAQVVAVDHGGLMSGVNLLVRMNCSAHLQGEVL